MRIGLRSRTSQSEGGYRTGSHRGTIVREQRSAASELILLTLCSGKKLKKRLEDLERRAGSSSASPEQRHEELAQTETSDPSEQSPQAGGRRQRSSSSQIRRDRTPEVLHQQYVLPSDDRGMFSQQYTRQMSTSPPPFSYSTLAATDSTSYSTYPPAGSYCMPGNSMDMPVFTHYLPPIQNYQHIVPSMTSPPVKQEYYNDDEINPFSMSYASMAGEANSYQDAVAAYVSTMPRPQPPTYHRSQSYPQWPTNAG